MTEYLLIESLCRYARQNTRADYHHHSTHPPFFVAADSGGRTGLKPAANSQAEQASSEKATMSAEKKNNPAHHARQKSQMAGKMATAKKSDVVYASEEYFRQLTSQVRLYKAQEEAKVDWRETLDEAKKEKPEEEGNHPYIKLMPFTNPKQKQKQKAIQSQSQSESLSATPSTLSTLRQSSM